jgi:hypothetical protein
VTTAVATTDAGEHTESPAGGTKNVAMQVLAAVATGIGVLGFVTFFGGAILWVRAREAGLPANDAVAVIPKPVLVTTGASFLVPAVLLALLAVGTIYAIHLGFRLPRRIRTLKQAASAADLRRQAEEAKLHAGPKDSFALKAREIAAHTRANYEVAEKAGADLLRASQATVEGLDERLKELDEQAGASELAAQEAEQQARAADVAAAELAAQADLAEGELELARKTAPRSERRQRTAEYVASFGLLFALPVIVDWQAVFHTGALATAVLLPLALATLILSLATYLATEKFLWFGVVAFVGVGLFIGAAAYFRTKEQLKVEAAAALREGRPPAVGWFVAQTPDNLYLGTFAQGSGKKRLLVIPRSQVKDLAVGPLLKPTEARPRAIALALDLCRQDTTNAAASVRTANIKQPDKNGAQHPKPTQACSKRQVAALERQR